MAATPKRRKGGPEIVPVTADGVPALVEPCRDCAFWERGPGLVAGTASTVSRDKAAWVRRVEAEWGTPGWLVRVDGQPAGHLLIAPAHLAPRSLAFPTSPVADDAILLLAVRVDPRYAGQGLGRRLVQTAAREVLSHDGRAIEAFGTTRGDQCLTPVDFLTAVGFYVVREHAAYPRLRLDLRTALAWREDVEHALDRILAPVRRLGAGNPVGTANNEAPGAGRP
ncbi:MAG: GNAT family N-acetyltransferase [Actinomycetales bacterium]|jgi:GNAT superfamily N-acetyltransferase|uniref:GNAT family N-acetyltransferase n=1 Tax=Candidatus Phosphoribacter hodrii TaxID=2953743 RepID=A0A934X6T3_9MICO|nr:GNAT family N-acetyltransferase [Candidatus Phosphoribacter hodrii]